MYTLIRENRPPTGTTTPSDTCRGRARLRVSPTVLALGFTSLFTDISSEMVSSVLPLYFLLVLHFTPLGFGLIDGLYQGAGALLRIGGGLAADRWHRHKDVAAIGYAISAVCKIGLLAAGGSWAALTGVLLLDRTGKGVRTAPRDAMISLATPTERLGTAFGIHRALDTVGALIGPLVAFGLLTLLPSAFDVVFVVSFCVALIGLGILVLFVRNPATDQREAQEPPVSLQAALGVLATPGFRRLVMIGGGLGLATISDSFLYLVLQRRLHFSAGFFPLLYVATALAYFALAVPAGWLADRIGRGRVFVAGYILLLCVYTALLRPAIGTWDVIGYVLLFGAYYAATDGVLMAMASEVVPPDLRTSGLGLLTTVTGLSRLLSSVLFGALWTQYGAQAAVRVLLVGLLATTLLAAGTLARRPTSRSGDEPAHAV